MEESNKRIIFNLPGEITLIEVIGEILKNNGLEESVAEAYEKSVTGEDSKLIIIRDAAMTMFQKIMPDNQLAEFLSKHLETSQEHAEGIVRQIKEKLIPYAKMVNEDGKLEGDDAKEKAKQDLLKKIRQHESENQESEPAKPYDKKIDTTNVEENAAKIQQEKKVAKPQKDDSYREPIE